MKRPLGDRIRDRLWREAGQRLCLDTEAAVLEREGGGSASVSGDMPWSKVCAAFAEGALESRNFRRLRAVKNVVETVGITEARFYAKRIGEWGGEWLEHPKVREIDAWGNPIRCPAFLLGTSRPFSPTTLRYLATALWLQRGGKLAAGARILEIGVGFGGLAAMNALVSGSTTMFVDLPQVEKAALRMLGETGMEHAAAPPETTHRDRIPLVVSNYAFTELSSGLQEEYLHKHLRFAEHGMIVSNAGVFSGAIGGRGDEELVAWLRAAGIPAVMEKSSDLLTPIDALCDVSLIHW